MRYLGGKSRSAKHIVPLLKAAYEPSQAYVEPFIGSGWVMQDMDVEGVRLGADIHGGLIAMWTAMQSGWLPPAEITREEWLDLQARKLEVDPLVAYAGFCSFGGVYFASYLAGSAPGSKRSYQAAHQASTVRKAERLKGVELEACSYLDLALPPASLIYCDPPYAGTGRYRCTPKFDSVQFWHWTQDVANAGHTVFVSEFSAPESPAIQEVWAKPTNVSIAAGQAAEHRKSTERLYRVHPL